MLVRTNTASRRPIDGLAAIVGERAFCSEFKYRRGTEIFGDGDDGSAGQSVSPD